MVTTITERDTTKTYSGLPAPNDWHIVEPWGDGLFWERMVGQRITVIEDITEKADGRMWLHVSVAKPNKKIPTYEDLQEVRRLFIGEDRECYMVFPPKERYVNLGNVLHLWCCMEQEKGILPNFDEIVELWVGLISSRSRPPGRMTMRKKMRNIRGHWTLTRRRRSWLITNSRMLIESIAR